MTPCVYLPPTPPTFPLLTTDSASALTRLARLMLSVQTRHCPRLRSSPKEDAVSFLYPFPSAGPVVAPEARTHENRLGTARVNHHRAKQVNAMSKPIRKPVPILSPAQGPTPPPTPTHDSSHDRFRHTVNEISDPLSPRTLQDFLTIGEQSLRHLRQPSDLQLYRTALEHRVRTEPALRSVKSDIYFRILRLAALYNSLEVSISIQSKWVSRIHWGELRPVWAMVCGEQLGLRDLLAHGCYTFLLSVETRIKEALASPAGLAHSSIQDERGLLTSRLLTHVLSGYHSLRAFWSHLASHPLEFESAEGCEKHSQCVGAWNLRWVAAIRDKPCPLAEVDVLKRLMWLELGLAGDLLLGVCMETPCKVKALEAVKKKREVVSRQLHHHFVLP
ncbi:hypothetical protein M413DRAFT_445752 [Hebeloma cylindrosporum]|uniref:Uncharacterized protein n=1 Tax=Hebeloma cylindrosporum TaxID=76867 RepID=A0A0C3BWJ2_HEBCY|nr:hypothetical protein M413DRAFT_445752 [Hebeloma cylindrosporum h7]